MKRIQRLISVALFVCILVAIVVKSSDVLEYKGSREKYTPFFESKTNFDVIFLGTSHMYCHVLPMELWKDYGIASYNWGYSNCTPAEDYYLIQDILNYTSPKVVVIDVFGLTVFDTYENGNGKYKPNDAQWQHVQFDSFPVWSKSRVEGARDVFDDYENNEDFIWNFIMYHSRWDELNKNDFEYELTTEKGAMFLTGLSPSQFIPIKENQKTTINSTCLPYFLKTIEYCQERGIEVLCVNIPYPANESLQMVANTIPDIIADYPNCAYVNMLTKDIVDFGIDNADSGHLNYAGSCKVTNWLGQYLKDHYQLEDYSLDSSWQEDYIAYQEHKQSVIKEQTTLPAYLIQLTDDDFSAKAQVYDSSVLDSVILVQLFKNAGITPEYVKSDSKECAKLSVYKSDTGELVDEAMFVNNNTNAINILNINKEPTKTE